MPDPSPVRVLIADDQPDVLNALRLLLLDEGFEVIEARSPGEAIERVEATDFDLAILDLNYARDTALTRLRSHAWPGNVRELAHTIERAVLMATRPRRASASPISACSRSVSARSRPHRVRSRTLSACSSRRSWPITTATCGWPPISSA